MQMKKNGKKGVTLVALVITVIVLILILGMTLRYDLSGIHNVENKKLESELAIVQEAIMQRYALAKSSNKLGIIAIPIIQPQAFKNEEASARPKEFVGERLSSVEDIRSKGFGDVDFEIEYYGNDDQMTYEEYYYLIGENDLADLGIEKGDSYANKSSDSQERQYIVNYLTGEVFDVRKQRYYKTNISDSDPIYRKPTQVGNGEDYIEYNDN